jgi:hypothetical protein
MSFDPCDFLAISEELNQTASEAHRRSLANRAYYAAFGYIKSKDSNFVSSEMSVHRDLLGKLKTSGNINLGKCGSLLETLFKGRKHADYDYRKEFKSIDCSYTLEYARKVISHYKSYLSSQEEQEE